MEFERESLPDWPIRALQCLPRTAVSAASDIAGVELPGLLATAMSSYQRNKMWDGCVDAEIKNSDKPVATDP